MIEKKIYYVWIGEANKPDIFYKCLNSWKENLKEYEIIEINDKNFDIKKHYEKNRFFRECWDRKLWAFVSDYIRVQHLYENGGIYLDIDMEIIKDISPLMENEKIDFFIGYENKKHISVGIFGCSKNNEILKDIIKFYENDIWEKPIWTIPKIFTYIFEKKYNLSEKRENILKIDENKEILIYPKEYFYPYGYNEIFSEKCITLNTYGIHWWNESWIRLKARLFLETKHLRGVKKIIKYIRIVIRYFIIEKRYKI